jgi:DNA repair exonuclease SbcCD nuclease subunit
MTADIHNGLPNKLRDTIWSMEVISKYASEHDIENILVLGDLFHNRTSVEINVLQKVYEFMKSARPSWICFPGNHDIFLKNSWEISPLYVLRDAIHVIDKVCDFNLAGIRFWVLPFIYQELTYMETLQEIDKQASKDDILLTHIGVCGAVMNECFLLKNWSIVKFDDTKFDKIFAGHYHCYQTIGKLTYPGSPISFRFDEGVVDHGFIVFDTETRAHEFVLIADAAKGNSYIAPDYLTIIDKDLKNRINMIKGNNIKIMLSKDMNPNQISKIKSTLHKLGAISVTTGLITKQIQEPTLVYKEKNFGSPKQLFTEFVNAENPKLDKELLHKLHDSISQEAEERALIEISSDAEIADQ